MPSITGIVLLALYALVRIVVRILTRARGASKKGMPQDLKSFPTIQPRFSRQTLDGLQPPKKNQQDTATREPNGSAEGVSDYSGETDFDFSDALFGNGEITSAVNNIGTRFADSVSPRREKYSSLPLPSFGTSDVVAAIVAHEVFGAPRARRKSCPECVHLSDH